ncbi:MAG TPA: type II CAAX endopeptidase family protein [Pirellulales bacterium]|jgi:membrane protease YdiL (CAAX protease family)|nr:type II CAAX endopeptidase family protein [Pirellulales bacterium]
MDGSIDDHSSIVPNREVQTWEVTVFLFLIVPSMILSLFVIRQGQLSFLLAATATILRDLGLVSLILFFLWRNGESVTSIGWTWRFPLREVLIGVLCFIPVCLSAAFLEWALLRVGLSASATPLPSFLKAQGLAEAPLALLLVTVVALAEETIFRGYLLLRFQFLLGNVTASVLLSSAIFAVGHGYEGSAGVVTIGMMGAVLALVYLWRGSLVASMVIHFLQDFLGIVLLPLLDRK